jgi:MFS family permease
MKPAAFSRDQLLLYAAAFLRSLSIGLSGVLLAVYLSAAGWDASRIGLLVAAGLAGTAVATLAVSFLAERLGRRRTLVILSLLSVFGAISLAATTTFPALLAAAFIGMVNGMGRDRGAAFSLDQATLPETLPPEARTQAFAGYNLVLDAGHALGSLLASLPFALRRWEGLALLDSYRATWLLSAVVGLVALGLYALLSRRVEAARPATPQKLSPQSKRVVAKLASLTAMDSLGGGFLTGALVSYWFFRRFGVGEELLGPLFFAARIANALSYLGAAWLARRIGLVNTMVFTHIPSSLFLIAVPFAPTFPLAVALFLARESLVEMDVPTRQSYLTGVVQPAERAFASGITNLARSTAWAVAPSFAGYAMKAVSLSSPLFIGGGIKIAYDLLLFVAFRRLKPPEETAGRRLTPAG